MKKQIALIIGIIILVCNLTSCKYHSLSAEDEAKIKENTDSFHTNLIKECTDYKTIALKDITPFEWDKVFLFRTYYPKEDIIKKVGINWSEITDTLSEGITNMIFMKDEKIVCYYLGYNYHPSYGSRNSETSYWFGDENLELDINDNPKFTITGIYGSTIELQHINN